MTKSFQPSRSDGRSDKRVVFELICDAEPNTIFTKDQLREALQEGIDFPITDQRIGGSVRGVRNQLLAERQRYLLAIAGVGYRVIRSDEHLPVALARKSRGHMQIKQGVDLLRNTDLSELSDAQINIHKGQLMIMSAICQITEESARRIKKHDDLIASLTSRVAKLEDEEAA